MISFYDARILMAASFSTEPLVHDDYFFLVFYGFFYGLFNRIHVFFLRCFPYFIPVFGKYLLRSLERYVFFFYPFLFFFLLLGFRKQVIFFLFVLFLGILLFHVI